jgi:hypothetical protein
MIDGQCTDLITACQEFMLGNKDRRAGITGEGKLAVLTHTVNMLLDQQEHLLLPEPARNKHDLFLQENDVVMLNRQIGWLTEALRPALDGDLRVQANIRGENVEVLARMCNELVEKLALFTRWILYISEKVLSTVHTLSDRSLEIAEATETRLFHLAEMAKKADTMAEFMQRTQEALHKSSIALQSLSDKVQQEKTVAAHIHASNGIPEDISLEQGERQTGSEKTIEQFTSDIEEQRQHLNDFLVLTQKTKKLQASLSADIVTFSQAIHQSSMQFLEASEQVHSLIAHAERWRDLARTVQLAKD